MNELGFKATLKKSKPFLSDQHQKNRLKWCKKHQNWTVDDWKKVIFSDETKINIFGPDSNPYTWKEDGAVSRPHHVKQTVRYGGGSLMMWGCMAAKGVGYACQIFDDYYGWKHKDVIFQHDNDPKHTSKHTKRWMKRKGIQLLQDWPAQSPDLNPIEHLWRHLKHKLHSYDNRAANVDELWQRVCKEWDSFTPDDVEPYYRSMPKRIKAVIKAGGGSIKY
ncbi:hypothetical protein G6F49_012954 [Rhizopus delemar]|nr:hypothetical protein G6F49_012954 [Rhizopus delemar]